MLAKATIAMYLPVNTLCVIAIAITNATIFMEANNGGNLPFAKKILVFRTVIRRLKGVNKAMASEISPY